MVLIPTLGDQKVVSYISSFLDKGAVTTRLFKIDLVSSYETIIFSCSNPGCFFYFFCDVVIDSIYIFFHSFRSGPAKPFSGSCWKTVEFSSFSVASGEDDISGSESIKNGIKRKSWKYLYHVPKEKNWKSFGNGSFPTRTWKRLCRTRAKSISIIYN